MNDIVHFYAVVFGSRVRARKGLLLAFIALFAFSVLIDLVVDVGLIWVWFRKALSRSHEEARSGGALSGGETWICVLFSGDTGSLVFRFAWHELGE